MRLIDADALKEVFKETDVHYGGKIKELIDEAPTVEQKYYERVVANVTFDRDQLNEIVEKAKAEVLESIKIPHGEWEVLPPSVGYPEPIYVCPFCDWGTDENSNFCPRCGADMRQEETKDDE